MAVDGIAVSLQEVLLHVRREYKAWRNAGLIKERISHENQVSVKIDENYVETMYRSMDRWHHIDETDGSSQAKLNPISVGPD